MHASGAGQVMEHSHQPLLVVLSVLVALVGSYAALDLLGQFALAGGRARALWLGAASLALGVAIWAMHFVAMLSYRLPVPVGWDLGVVAVALAVSVAGSGAGLALVTRRLPLGGAALPVGAVFVGFAIVGMHFTGMSAVRVAAVQGYAPVPLTLSVAAAVALSGAALWLALRAGRGGPLSGEAARRGGGALLLAGGIVGMHYLAMYGTHFAATGDDPAAAAATGIRGTAALAWSSGAGAMCVSALAVAGSLYGRRLDRSLAQLRALGESERRFRSLFRHVPDVAAILEADGTVRHTSPSVERVLGYAPEELAGTDALDLVHPDDRGRVRRLMEEHLPDPDPRTRPSLRLRFRRKDGSWCHAEVVSTNRLADPEVRGLVVALRDVTERAGAEARLRESEARLSAVTRGAPVILFALDREGVFTFEGGAGLEALGLEAGQSVGRSVFETYAAFPRALANFRRALGGEEVTDTLEISGRAYHATYSPQRGEDGGVSGVVGVATDVTERKRLEEEFAHSALHDPLTGLSNRRLFADRLGQALARSAREGGALAVLFVDLDDFKVVNDSLGHAAGDRLLTEVAARLDGCLRPGDTAARLGGDEFAVLLEGAGRAEAEAVAGRIAGALRPPVDVGGREVFATASVGIALGGETADRAEGPTRDRAGELMRAADLAMYRAKWAGKARHEVFEPGMGAAAEERLELEGDLRRALADPGGSGGEIVVRYQPKVSLGSGRIYGMEALARWKRPGRGTLLPGRFVPLAEETGLIFPLGRRVLREACRQARRWRDALGEPRTADRNANPAREDGTPPPVVCVNVSARQLGSPELLRDVEAALWEAGLPPGALQLEITEGSFVTAPPGEPGNAAPALALLEDLRNLGVGLSVDDFGTGYSSLSYLKRLPVDAVKVDQSFVSGLGQDSGDEDIVAAILSVARALGLEAVAEGVETEVQLGLLREMGCDLAQGDLFSEPVPAEEALRLVADDPRWP